MRDPYKVLGISPNATDEEIKRAYRSLSRKYHPDANINNPYKEQAEERFKEVQQAYDQIMKEKQQGYNYGYGGGYGSQRNSSYGGGYGGHSYSNYNTGYESVRMTAAANYINSQNYREALNVLNGMAQNERVARWYYFSAIANAGVGNNVTATEHAPRAVDMEPGNMEYRQLLQQLSFGGSWYRDMGTSYGYGRPISPLGGLCLTCIGINLLFSCCLRPLC